MPYVWTGAVHANVVELADIPIASSFSVVAVTYRGLYSHCLLIRLVWLVLLTRRLVAPTFWSSRICLHNSDFFDQIQGLQMIICLTPSHSICNPFRYSGSVENKVERLDRISCVKQCKAKKPVDVDVQPNNKVIANCQRCEMQQDSAIEKEASNKVRRSFDF